MIMSIENKVFLSVRNEIYNLVINQYNYNRLGLIRFLVISVSNSINFQLTSEENVNFLDYEY